MFFNFYIQSLCIIVVYHSVSTTALGIKLDIEDIIDKILTSDKINILIERVADRAVEKIRSQMRPESISKIRQLPPEQRYSSNRDSRPSGNILRNDAANLKIKDMPREKLMEMPVTTKYKKPVERLPYRGQPGKIDNQAVKEKYASFPYEQLSLKYKKFISKEGREREVKNTERTTPNYEEKNNFETVMLNKPERPERQEHYPIKKEKQYEFKYKSEEKKAEDFDLSADNQKSDLKYKYSRDEEDLRNKGSYSHTNYDKSYGDSKKLTYFADSKFKAHSGEEMKPKEILPESLSKGKRLFKDASVEPDGNDEVPDDAKQTEGSNENRKEEQITIVRQEGERILSVGNAPEDAD